MRGSRLWSTWRRVGVDVLLLAGSFMAAVLIHFDGAIPSPFRARIPFALGICVGTMVIGLVWARTYRKVSDFISLSDFVGVLRGAGLASLALVCANGVTPQRLALPWALVTMFLLLSLLSMTATLFTRRIWRESMLGLGQDAAVRRRILIYGAGRAGSMVARDIRQSPDLGYELAGFIDDDSNKWGKEIYGARVLGGRHELPRFLGPNLREVVLAIPSLDADVRRDVLSHCRRAGAHVRTVPGIAELLRDSGFAHQIRDVCVEDLLSRDAVELDETIVREMLVGQTVLVTGAAGSIGSELCHQILRHEPAQLLLVEQSESRLFYLERDLKRESQTQAAQVIALVADIRDRERMERILSQHRPSFIFHAAAYKHVPMMESNPQEAVRNNVVATHGLAQLANQYDVGCFTLVSTDKAVEPTSVMGASKRCAELILRELQHTSQTRYVTVRFGNVLDSDGSVVPLFKQQIASGGPITITHPEMERFFMTIPEAARLILKATALSERGEVFVLEMGKPVRILDLARSLVELSGLRFMEDIQVSFTGVRAGEKLTEKLFFDHEQDVATRNKQIHRAKLENGSRLDVPELLRTLEVIMRSSSDERQLAARFMALARSLDEPESAALPKEPPRVRGQRSRVVPIDRMLSAGL